MKIVKLEEIRRAKPFTNLFPIAPAVLARVQEDMERHGFDASQPIVMWAEKGVVIDGHTRLEAAKSLGIKEVPVHEKSFVDVDEALAYAIHNQRDRRNLSSADILRLVDTLDTRLKRGERTDLASGDAKSPEASKRKSAAKTAATIGVSQATVERTRTILEHAPLRLKEEVEKGKKSIKAAYEETQAGRKIKKETKPPIALKTEDAPEGARDKKKMEEMLQTASPFYQYSNKPRKSSELYFFEAEQFAQIAISQLSRVVMDKRAIPSLMSVRNYIDDLIGKINHEK
jgi:ParB-like chromosome segregation protein Spo0J